MAVLGRLMLSVATQIHMYSRNMKNPIAPTSGSDHHSVCETS